MSRPFVSGRANALPVAVALLLILFLAAQLLHYGYARDHGIYTAVADALLRGEVPYRDAWDFKPPGVYVIYAMAEMLFGSDPSAIRIMEALCWATLIPAFVILSARFVGSRAAGVVAAAVAWLAYVPLEAAGTGQPEGFGGILLAWAVVFATTPVQNGRPPLLAWLAAGTCYGAAALLKPPLGGGIVVSWAFALRSVNGPSRRSTTLAFVGGGLTPLLVTLGWFWAHGAIGDLWDALFGFAPQYTALAWDGQGPLDLAARALYEWLLRFTPYNLAGVVVLVLLPPNAPGERRGALHVFCVVLTVLIGVALQGKFFGYHYAALFPLTGLLAGWGYWKLWRLRSQTRARALAGLLTLLIAFQLLPGARSVKHQRFWSRTVTRVAALYTGEPWRELRERLYNPRAQNNRLAGEWLKSTTAADATIFVWGFEPQIYELSGRAPASRYIYNVPQRADWSLKASRAQLMADLARKPPAAILVQTGDEIPWVTGNEKDSRAALADFPELEALLAEQFRPTRTFGHLEVYERRTEVSARSARRPRVLLLTVDTLRPDFLSLNGYDRPTTPFLDTLLSRGFVFEHAMSPIGRTTQALSSLLTGLYPQDHGVLRLTDRLPGDVPYLPDLARRAGYATVAVVSNHILRPERGLDRGFDVYDFGTDRRNAAATTDAALARLSQLPPDAMIFAWVHYIDPHVPYFPPPDLAREFDPGYQGPYALSFGQEAGAPGRKAYPSELGKVGAVFNNELPERVNSHLRRLYAAEIRATDDAIRRLLRGLEERWPGGWTVVFAADHGESLGEHGYYYDHGDYVYQSSLRVPLALVLPPKDPLAGQAHIEAPVSLIDVMPTLSELLGIAPSPTPGRSLLGAIRGETLPARPLFAESGQSHYRSQIRRRVDFEPSGRFRSVLDGEWKLIWTPGLDSDHAFELYHLPSDPGELENLYRPGHPEVRRLADLLRARVAAEPRSTRKPTPEDLEALRSLGYIE